MRSTTSPILPRAPPSATSVSKTTRIQRQTCHFVPTRTTRTTTVKQPRDVIAARKQWRQRRINRRRWLVPGELIRILCTYPKATDRPLEGICRDGCFFVGFYCDPGHRWREGEILEDKVVLLLAFIWRSLFVKTERASSAFSIGGGWTHKVDGTLWRLFQESSRPGEMTIVANAMQKACGHYGELKDLCKKCLDDNFFEPTFFHLVFSFVLAFEVGIRYLTRTC